MSLNQNIDLNNEIDLKEIFLLLWRGKSYIIFFSLVCVFFASLHLRSADRQYTVEYRLKPVSEAANSNSFDKLGGLASIAGIQLPSNSNSDFRIFKELITSVEVSAVVFENKKLITDIFKSEWNSSLNNYSRPPQSKIQKLVSDVKKLLTGNEEIEYMHPNPRRLASFVAGNIQINEDKETGFLKITSLSSNPDLILSLIVEVTKASDAIMRHRYVGFSNEPLSFYKKQLRTARSREHRESLAELIGAEEEKLMFASLGKYFIAEPYLKPTISLYPTTPKPKLVLSLSLVLGLIIGAALVLIRSSILKDDL